jgi:formylglycine-generating enzyme required for sulfatase activity
MTAELNQEPHPVAPAAMSGDDRGISVGRDASGNAFVTGDHNQVKVVIYQQLLSERRQPEPPAATTVGPNPYMGLLAFHEEDAARFFGREAQITRLWERLRDLQIPPRPGEFRPRVLPVLGPSGSGKSSVVRAGLIPELARRLLPGWRDVRVAVLKPGTRPVEELARVMARIATGDATPVQKTAEFETVLKTKGDTGICDGLRRIADALPQIADVPLLVLVDQFEELYSLCTDVVARTAFIENLLHAASDATSRVSVVITLRTDFLGETQTHEQLNRVICEQQVLIPAMSEAELRAAIAQPAALAGHPLDDALVTLLIEDSKDRIGALPLLQFALLRIWDGLTRGVPPAQTFEQIGGVGGALAGEAQRIFEQLENESDQRIAKRVFLGLVQLGEGTRDTRRRALIQNLVAVGEQLGDVERVIGRFASRDARLITLAADEQDRGDTAEITHEALLDNWKELRTWLNENRPDIRFSRRLDESARLWDQQGRQEGDLWRPPTLGMLREYHQRAATEMNPLQMEFFLASAKAEDARARAARRARRLSWALTSLSVSATIVAVVLWLYALQVGRNAQRGQIDALASAILLSPVNERTTKYLKTLEGAAPSGWQRYYAVERLKEAVRELSSDKASEKDLVRLASQEANVLAALMQLGSSSHVWSELEIIQSKLEANQGDPTLHSYTIHRLHETGVDPNTLLLQLDLLKGRPALLRVLLLSLGEYDASEIPPDKLARIVRQIVDLHQKNEDPGIHGASEWLLRRWKKNSEIKDVVEKLARNPKDLFSTSLPSARGWYVTKSGQTMVYFRSPVRFQMGSPETEQSFDRDDEWLHEVELTRSFAIADKEVAWESFRTFLQDQEYTQKLDPNQLIQLKDVESKMTSGPVTGVSWQVAAAYCNWLTEQELGKKAAETQRCYKPNWEGKYAAEMDVEGDFRRRQGYRPPTEAELEYACRAGTNTRWSHGDAEELLERFARYKKNGTSPVGSLKPNNFGLFDMHGNVYEWCQDWYDTYPANAKLDPLGPTVGRERVIRGASSGYIAEELRSARRRAVEPRDHWPFIGFRLAQSLAGIPPEASSRDKK